MLRHRLTTTHVTFLNTKINDYVIHIEGKYVDNYLRKDMGISGLIKVKRGCTTPSWNSINDQLIRILRKISNCEMGMVVSKGRQDLNDIVPEVGSISDYVAQRPHSLGDEDLHFF